MAMLSYDDWALSPDYAEQIRPILWEGYHLEEVIDHTFDLLTHHLSTGEIFERAKAIHDASPPTNPSDPSYAYTVGDLERLLRDGDFIYRRESKIGTLSFTTPQLKLERFVEDSFDYPLAVGSFGRNIVGYASLTEHWVALNLWWYGDLTTGWTEEFRQSRRGLDRLGMEIASTLIHEALHNHGFSHPPSPYLVGESPEDHEYFRTFPEVAAQAVEQLTDEHYPIADHELASGSETDVFSGEDVRRLFPNPPVSRRSSDPPIALCGTWGSPKKTPPSSGGGSVVSKIDPSDRTKWTSSIAAGK